MVQGLNPSGGWGFSAPVLTDLEFHPASCTMGTGSFSQDKEDWASFYHTPTSSIKVKERVELYLFCPSVPHGLF